MPTGMATIQVTAIEWLQEPTCDCNLPQEATFAIEMDNVYDREERINRILDALGDKYGHLILDLEYTVLRIYPAAQA